MNEWFGAVATVLVLAALGYIVWIRIKKARAQRQQRNNAANPFDDGVSPYSASVGYEAEQEAPKPTRAPFKLAIMGALGRLSDAEWEQLHKDADVILDRLKKAATGLAEGRNEYAESLLKVSLTHIRGSFGKGKHWLEAIVLADLALFCYFDANSNNEDAEWRFAESAKIAALWTHKYAWLDDMCAKRRVLREIAPVPKSKKKWGLF